MIYIFSHLPSYSLDLRSGWKIRGRYCVVRLCLDCQFVFVSDAKGLSNPSEVEGLREKVYASLETYTKQKYPDQPGR